LFNTFLEDVIQPWLMSCCFLSRSDC